MDPARSRGGRVARPPERLARAIAGALGHSVDLVTDGETLAIVPDIISVLDAETAIPITNETLRYGQRVAVMAVRVPEIMRSEAALAQFGPTAFGMDEAYVPLRPV